MPRKLGIAHRNDFPKAFEDLPIVPAIKQLLQLEKWDISDCGSTAEAAVGTGRQGGFEGEVSCCMAVRARPERDDGRR